MQYGRLLQHGSLRGRLLRPGHIARSNTLTAVRLEQLRPLASGSGGSGQERSWGELLSGAAELGSNIVQKLAKSVKVAASSILPVSKPQEDRTVRPLRVIKEEPPDVQLRAAVQDAFGRGVTGRIMGGLVGRAFGGMMKTIQQQNEAALGLQEEAAHAIKNDPEVQQQLGGSIRVGSPFSQEQSTMSINGRTTQRVRLQMLVVGLRGTAEAVVEHSGDSRRITVNLPGGGRIHVGSRSSGSRYDGGRVIDVEAEDVR